MFENSERTKRQYDLRQRAIALGWTEDRIIVIDNDYRPTRPAAWRLVGVRSPQSLIPLGERQLGERLIRSLQTAKSSRLVVIDAGEAALVTAGAHSLGWLVVEEPDETTGDISLLRLEFAADAKGTVEAVLVLGKANNRREVANARPASN